MALWTVPANPAVPVLAESLCDSGADTRRGQTRPAAWIQVAIQAVGAAQPDVDGHMCHLLLQFPSPARQRDGKRRRPHGAWYPTGALNNDVISVETDGGSFFNGTFVTAYLVGGTTGDQYEVTVEEFVPRDVTDPERIVDVAEDPVNVRLTRYVFSTGDPGTWVNFGAFPLWHYDFEVVQGQARLSGGGGLFLPLDNTSDHPRVPLSSPRIQIQPGIYQTVGRV